MDNVNWRGAVAEPVMPGQQLSPAVTCFVENCQYWADDDHCFAGEIEISGREAEDWEGTNCATFEE